jgi:hypothetical protein
VISVDCPTLSCNVSTARRSGEVRMDIPLNTKITAFCRRLGDSTLHDLARDHGVVSECEHALVAIQAGQIGPHLEADLDALDAMVARAMGGSDCI